MVKNTTKIKSCKATGCSRSLKSYGLCNKHARRYERYGRYDYTSIVDKRPAIIDGDIAKIPLGVNAKNGYAIIDIKDKPLTDLHNWNLGSDGYPLTTPGKYGKCVRLHNYLMPNDNKRMSVDHINRNRLDNRRANLRLCSMFENSCNRSLPSNNTTGFKGVRLSKSLTSPYIAIISLNGYEMYLGSFKTKEQAALAYDCAAIQLHGEFASTNLLQGGIA